MKRWARRLARLLLALAAALLLAAGAGWLWLRSAAGQGLVRAKVVEAVRGAIAGRLELGQVDLSATHLVAEGLTLYTPEGELVAEIARVEADFDASGLLARRLVLHQVSVERPRLLLVADERGLNLTRALAAKRLTPAGAAPELHLEVGALALTDGRAELTAGELRVSLADVGLTGSATLDLAPLRLTGALAAGAAMTAPGAFPLRLAVRSASPAAGAFGLDVDLALGDSRLAGQLAVPSLEAALATVELAPPTLRAFAPGWPVQLPLTAHGTLSTRRGALELAAGAGRVSATGAWDLGAGRLEALELDARELNLAELFAGGHPSRLTLHAKGALPDLRPATLTGELEVQGAWQTVEGHQLAAAHLEARAAKGQLAVDALSGSAPGATLTGRGTGNTTALAVTGTLAATDLARLAGALSEYTGAAPLPLGGRGALSFAVAGALTHPAVGLRGSLSGLHLGGLSAERLDVDARVPDLLRPLDSDGSLLAHRLTFAERTFEQLTASVTTQGRELVGEVSAKGLGDLVARVTGTVDRDGAGLALAGLSVSSSTGEWHLEAPSHVGWRQDVALAPLALRSGAQRLSLEGSTAGPRVDATVGLERLRLEALPRVLAPEALGLAGELTGRARVTGSLARPDVEASAGVRAGAVAGVTGIEGAVGFTWRAGRAAGTVQATSAVGGAAGDFDVPVESLLTPPARRRAEPVRAHLALTHLQLSQLAARLAVPAQPGGGGELVVDLTGESTRPALTARLSLPEVGLTLAAAGAERPARVTLQGLTVALATDSSGLLGATATATAFRGALSAGATTPLTVSGLLERWPTPAQLRALPVRVSLELTGAQLTDLAALASDDAQASGELALHAVAEGTLDAPLLRAKLALAHGRLGPVGGAGVTAELVTTAQQVKLEAALSVGGKPAGTLDAALEAPLLALLHPDALGPQGVAVTGTLTDLQLAELLPRGDEQESQTRGLARGGFTVRGTLDAPSLEASGAVQDLSFAKASLGAARFEWKGQGREHRVALALGAQGREELQVRGTVGVDLSLPSLRRGLEPGQAALALTAQARDLDVAFLSGVTDLVRVVGGRLTLDGAVGGTLGAPELRGTASWSKGRLGLLRYGDYRDIEASLGATAASLDVDRLRLRSGGGAATLQAHAAREAPGAYAVRLDAALDRFPIISDDQLVTTATLKVAAQGRVSATLVDFGEVRFDRVELELPDVKGKDVQDLQRPAEIIVLRGGETLEHRRRTLAHQRDPGAAPRRAVRLVLSAPQHVFVKSSDLQNVELELSEGFGVDLTDQPLVQGEVGVARGAIVVIGRKFTVQPGSTVRFAGAAREPWINVIGRYENPRENVTVTVTVVGRGRDLKLTTTSEPPMSQSEIYTLLATGRVSLQRGSGASMSAGQAASVIGALAAAQLKSVLAKKVPIDVLAVDSGEEGVQTLRVEVGKYLTDDLYLGYTGQVGANPRQGENPHAGRLEYRVSKRWTLEAYGGTAPAAGGDVMWSFDY